MKHNLDSRLTGFIGYYITYKNKYNINLRIIKPESVTVFSVRDINIKLITDRGYWLCESYSSLQRLKHGHQLLTLGILKFNLKRKFMPYEI